MISYIGGKNRISKWIIPYIPKNIETYVEVFGGMFWVFYNLNIEEYSNLKTIVYNDFNNLNSNLFRCVAENSDKLLEYCEKIPVQLKRDDGTKTPQECIDFFYESQKEIFSEDFSIGDINYDAASKYVLVLTSVFSGANPSGSNYIDLKGKYHSKFTSFMNKLKNDKWKKKFENISLVENKDFEEVIKKYDSPSTYFYVDPPYYVVGEGKYYSNHDFDRSDHERLSNCLKSIDGKFGLSYYDFPLLSEWFPKDKYVWEKKLFAKAAAAKAGKSQNMGEELLIMNYEI